MEFMDLVEKVGTVVAEAGKQVGSVVGEKTKAARDYARDAMEISSLKNQISAHRDAINKNYVTLGEYYYNKYEESPEADAVESVRAIDNAKTAITELEDKIAEIRAAQEEVKAAKQAAAEEEARAKSEQAAKAAEEVKETVSEAVSEAAEAVVEGASDVIIAGADAVSDVAEDTAVDDELAKVLEDTDI